MWMPVTTEADGAPMAGIPGGRVDDHLRTIPACAALGVRRVLAGERVLALAVDTEIAAVRARDGSVDIGAALLLADQATANGIFATLPAPVPMMTLGLRLDWMAPFRPGALVCAIDDVVREGDLALVRGLLTGDGGMIGTVTARYLLGSMPGGAKGHMPEAGAEPRSAAPSFDAYLDARGNGEGQVVVPRWDHVGGRPLPAFHGGVIAALLERTGSGAVGAGFRTLDMDVRFLSPGHADRPLHARAVPRKIGRRAATIDVTAFHDDPDRPVAIARMTAVGDAFADVGAFRLA